MLHGAGLVLAAGDVRPQLLHAAAYGRNRTLTLREGTFGSVPEEKEPLLLVPEAALVMRVVGMSARRRHHVVLHPR